MLVIDIIMWRFGIDLCKYIIQLNVVRAVQGHFVFVRFGALMGYVSRVLKTGCLWGYFDILEGTPEHQILCVIFC